MERNFTQVFLQKEKRKKNMVRKMRGEMGVLGEIPLIFPLLPPPDFCDFGTFQDLSPGLLFSPGSFSEVSTSSIAPSQSLSNWIGDKNGGKWGKRGGISGDLEKIKAPKKRGGEMEKQKNY